MRVLGTIGVILAIAALSAAPPDTPGPQIILADHTIAPDPPADPGNGSLPNGDALTPFDVQDPAVGRLDPALLSAIQNASTAATADGITMTITSGWRSPEFQQRLLDDAVHTYGSFTAAREYVQTPEASKHVVGAAVDVGGVSADQWLIANGTRFGLCRIYANELWHFELATGADGNCPPLLPNAG
ncbi:D-alanyl-D-alanine carboxypeptidase [Mycobacterium antarcticum]|uniref:M15 family metallopeptidase n=1 Tax=unclassified Mycolicibacterium TaxID=2636767 RepID=UPI002390294A|nr:MULTISPECIES: M15 family metallopeptidase [unclassified Mycolicibacterium]BDX29807.1 D-alanyl-D-alanine carboxypeptidase [Mycolicibacterium sp. TUM20985]GLP73233.1 D-alanyl-D-alanine carboxypeptidase [Mycolicibacterium sp. TUM20983]